MSERLDVVIVGGGTAGWMCAAALSSVVGNQLCNIRLVESEEIATIGVGEATIPAIKSFNDLIGISEAEMMSYANATFKLGIEFVDWGARGTSYIHPFGAFGQSWGGVDFVHHWVRANKVENAQSIENYSYAIQACRHNKFEFAVTNPEEINSTYSYAYHLDAGLYAQYLRQFSEARGLRRTEGKIVQINKDPGTGYISSLRLESGEEICGHLFIDCTGFRSMLLGQELGVPFEDWSRWLLCDRACTAASDVLHELPPYTRAVAKAAGWQWRIPLRHRTGNGLVYCSQYLSDDEASHELLSGVKNPTTEPKLLQFQSGRRTASWSKNCVALGLSSGFLEPLESTSIYLIQVGIEKLIKFFPRKRIDDLNVREFNRLIDIEYDRVRDFLILHYHLNSRSESELWRYCREMDIPDSLRYKLDIFRQRGYVDS